MPTRDEGSRLRCHACRPRPPPLVCVRAAPAAAPATAAFAAIATSPLITPPSYPSLTSTTAIATTAVLAATAATTAALAAAAGATVAAFPPLAAAPTAVAAVPTGAARRTSCSAVGASVLSQPALGDGAAHRRGGRPDQARRAHHGLPRQGWPHPRRLSGPAQPGDHQGVRLRLHHRR